MDWVKKADFSIFRAINLHLHSPVLDPIFTVFAYSGLGLTLVICFLGLLIPKQTRWLVPPLFATLILSGWIVADAVLKPLLDRDRPSNLAMARVAEPIFHSSFPSGHSCVSFGTAFTVLFLTWNSPNRKYGFLLLLWAALVGMSRIYRGVHWPSDVLAGFLVGLSSASVVVVAYHYLIDRKAQSS